jgi:hypothetical protein
MMASPQSTTPAAEGTASPAGDAAQASAQQPDTAAGPQPSPESSTASESGPAPADEPDRHETDEEVVERLAALDAFEYGRVRKLEAKALGIPVRILDERVKELRDKHGESGRLPWSEVQPHPDPVDPAELLDEVTGVILRFVVMDAEQAHAAAVWAVHTYLVDLAEVSPLLIIDAPEKACAKTLLQTVLGRMCRRPLPASNASLSALFRAVELRQPTILIDEADTFFRDNAELQGLVNAGYARTGYVLRSEVSGDSYEPRMFAVYSAKSIAGIALERHLPDSTMSRGIVLNLRRKRPHEVVARLRHADDDLFERVAAKLTRFATDFRRQIASIRPQLPDELSDRAQDNWEPLLAIAECAGPAWLQRATNAALTLSSASDAATSTGNELLADIREVFERKQVPKISTSDLITELIDDEEQPWATYNRGKPISSRQLAKQLKPYGIKSKTVRLGPHNTPKGYELSQFEDAFARYLGGAPDAQQPRTDPSGSKTDGVADAPASSAGGSVGVDDPSPDPDLAPWLGPDPPAPPSDGGSDGVF